MGAETALVSVTFLAALDGAGVVLLDLAFFAPTEVVAATDDFV